MTQLQTRQRILVVDDEEGFVWIIQTNLEKRGYQVLTAHDGRTAVTLARTEQPDLIILDIKMPVMDGLAACQEIRTFSIVPIIMLTARAEEADKIKGLDMGADDYITKPFSIEELLARIRANLRRGDFTPPPSNKIVFEAGSLYLDTEQKRLYRAGQELHLTTTEYRLLNELVSHAGQVVSTEYLLGAVWGPGYEGEEQVLRQVIYRLRLKIEADPKNPRYLHTRPGLGYIFTL